MKTHLFTGVFPAISRWFEEAVLEETGDEFSIIYIFITLFVSNGISAFDYVSNFVFILKKRNKVSRNHIFKLLSSFKKQN